MNEAGAVFSSTVDYASPSIVLTSPQGWAGNIVDGGQAGYENPSHDRR